jgi:hypothetical protein
MTDTQALTLSANFLINVSSNNLFSDYLKNQRSTINCHLLKKHNTSDYYWILENITLLIMSSNNNTLLIKQRS